MNLKNMRKLLAALRSRKNPVKFDMGNWFDHNNERMMDKNIIRQVIEKHPCGTVACLAGHAAILAWKEGEVDNAGEDNPIFETAQKFLGLTHNQARHLFYGHWSPKNLHQLTKIPKTHAIKELTRLIGD